MSGMLDINAGILLLATDLHGNMEDYRKVKDIYRQMKNKGQAHRLVLMGDLIHRYQGEPHEDGSKEILDDLMSNTDPSIITLMGNHELMHIYRMDDVSKNGQFFVPELEERISDDREKYISFMKSMFYAVRTKGGVMINHPGASAAISGVPYGGFGYMQVLRQLTGNEFIEQLDHDSLEKAARFFGEGNTFRGFMEIPQGQYLWEVFFNKNEMQYGDSFYKVLIRSFLDIMSRGFEEQRFLVSGHIPEQEGHRILHEKQLRISSSYGAAPGKKTLAVVDAKRRYESIQELVNDLRPLE